MGGIKSRAVGETEWTESDIGEQPLTIICHQGDVRVEPTDQLPLDSEVTVYHGRRVVNIDPVAKAWAEHILGYQLENVPPEDRVLSEAHIIGLCDLPIKLMQTHKRILPFFVNEPETYLHPSQQSRVMDMFVSISNNLQDDGSFTVYPKE